MAKPLAVATAQLISVCWLFIVVPPRFSPNADSAKLVPFHKLLVVGVILR
jgi:hypothetical protein